VRGSGELTTPLNLLTWFLDRLERRRTDVQVRVHRAFLLNAPGQPEAWFVNVLNASPSRAVGITHVWIEMEPPMHVVTRKPPSRLAPDEEWETWIETGALPPGTGDLTTLARVRLTTGRVIKSVARRDVPPAGFVPG
jgi:hypothetical protein